MKIPQPLKIIFSLLFHFIFIAAIGFIFMPIAQWYFFHRPILGVDFYNTATYAHFLKDSLNILPNGFKYFWWGGSPVAEEVVYFWFVIYSYFTHFFTLIDSVKIASLFFFFLLLVFVYLASYRLSKNHFFALLIATLVVFSANMYGSLVWGGSLPYFANQFLFPAVLWMIASYLETGNKRWYYLAMIAVGISMYGHLANATAFILVGAIVPLLFGRYSIPITVKNRFLTVLVFAIVVYLFAYQLTQPLIFGYINQFLHGNFSIGLGGGTAAKVNVGATGVSVSGDSGMVAVERSHFGMLFANSNTWLIPIVYVAFISFAVGFILDKKRSKALSVLPWLLLASYSVIHVYLNAYGIQFLSQAWYRAFWHFPITVGLFASALVGYFYTGAKARFARFAYVVYPFVGLLALFGLALVFMHHDDQKTIAILEKTSSPASSHPEALNLVRNQQELDSLKTKLTPSWLDPMNKNYRLLTSDAQVNVWWNSIFDMPLARGYIDPPVGSGVAGDHFLLDQAIGGDGLVTNFKYPENAAKNMGLYYMDWYAVKYMEGGHLSKSPNKDVSTYLSDAIDKKEEVAAMGAYILYQTKSGKPEVHEDVPQYLHFTKFKDELVTPILSINNSPSIICFCNWGAYESLTKSLSMNNINSQQLVTVFYDNPIDSLSPSDLAHFAGAVLVNYKYNNKGAAFGRLSDFIKSGGKVFVDTGAEGKESKAFNLPDLFPFRNASFEGLGKTWNLEISKDEILQNIDLSAFSPPVYNEFEWKLSYPIDSVEQDAKVLLKHQGKPILIQKKMENGTVVWSGMNLLYHIHSKTNVAESALFIKLLNSLIPLKKNMSQEGIAHFASGRNVTFEAGHGGSAVLFKEEFFPGWNVSINGRSVKAYASGPTYPGFIYVPLEKNMSNEKIVANFTFNGSYYLYILKLVTILIFIFLLDMVVFNGKFVGSRVVKFAQKTTKIMMSWWQKEEE